MERSNLFPQPPVGSFLLASGIGDKGIRPGRVLSLPQTIRHWSRHCDASHNDRCRQANPNLARSRCPYRLPGHIVVNLGKQLKAKAHLKRSCPHVWTRSYPWVQLRGCLQTPQARHWRETNIALVSSRMNTPVQRTIKTGNPTAIQHHWWPAG